MLRAFNDFEIYFFVYFQRSVLVFAVGESYDKFTKSNTVR